MNVESIIHEIGADSIGLRRLIICLDCLEQGLTTPSELRSFFQDMSTEWTKNPPPPARDWSYWPEIWISVSSGLASSSTRQSGYVRNSQGTVSPYAPGTQITSTVSESTWRGHHLREKIEESCTDGVALPEFPIGMSPKNKDVFNKFITQGNIFKESTPTDGAWLGRPSEKNANCWVTVNRVDLSEPIEEWSDTVEDTIPSLGIWPSNPLEAWVRYWIDADRLKNIHPGAQGQRPGFADGGSNWFRVFNTADKAQRHSRWTWGSTVNLNRLGVSGQDDTGQPERVIPSIPISSPAIIRCELLMPANMKNMNQNRKEPDQDQFDELLKRGRTGADIIQELLAAISEEVE
jgi:hypothetical protein